MEEPEYFSIVGTEVDLPYLKEERKQITESFVPTRPPWSSRYKCFQAYTCITVSYLSSLKFCQSMGKYGVIIIVPYLIFYTLSGIPAVLVELMIGRYVMGNIVKVWNMCPPARGVFVCAFLVTAFIITNNHLCNMYLLKYIFMSFYPVIPWGSCKQNWNNVNCYKIGQKSEAFSHCLETHPEAFCRNVTWETSGTQFWRYFITNNKGVLEVCWSLLSLAGSVLISISIVYKGIISLEKAFNLLVYPSVIIWAIFAVVTLSFSDAINGLKIISSFDWNVILDLQVWVTGFKDTFYFLCLGRLSLTFISSHGKTTDNILLDVLTVNFSGIIACIVMTTPILCMIAYANSLENQFTREELFKGMSEISIFASEALLLYPYPTALWCIMFYLDCFLISCSSQAVLILAVCEALQGIFKKETMYIPFLIAISVGSFLLAFLISFFEDLFNLQIEIFIVSNVLLCTITWQLFYGIQKLNSDYYFLMGYPTPLFIKFTWIILIPLPLAALIYEVYWGINKKKIHNMIICVGIPFFIYFSVIIIQMILFKTRKVQKVFLHTFTANPDWGPENYLLKKSRIVFDTSTVITEFMYRQELYKKTFMVPPDISRQNIVQLI